MTENQKVELIKVEANSDTQKVLKKLIKDIKRDEQDNKNFKSNLNLNSNIESNLNSNIESEDHDLEETKNDEEKIVTNGGRVLAVTSFGKDIDEAVNKSFDNAAKINFNGKYYRKDIGFDLL